MSQITIFNPENAIEVFSPYKSQLQKLREHNNRVAFDYESKKGNKEARSHVFALRQSKSSVEKTRKSAKEDSLKYGKKIDEIAKEITKEIEDMIAVHQTRIDEIEERERKRIAHLEAMVATFSKSEINAESSSHEIEEAITEISTTSINDDFQEFKTKAFETRDETIARLKELLPIAIKREEEKRELERLREEAQERAIKEHNERIAREAEERARIEAERKADEEKRVIEERARKEIEEAERAKREAEQKAEKEREDAKRRELELKLEKEKAERRAEQAKREERERIEREEQAKKEAEEARELDIQNKKRVHNEIVSCLSNIGIEEDVAKSIVKALAKGMISNVKITY